MKQREEGIRSQVGGNQSGELWYLKTVNEHAIKLGYSQRQTVGSPQFCINPNVRNYMDFIPLAAPLIRQNRFLQ